jgi:serine/threonine protein kinase
MNQPTDPRSSNGADRGASDAEAPRRSRSQQDTVLLSDVPEAESMRGDAAPADETRISSRGTNSPASAGSSVPNSANLTLSSAALAALGQRYDILDAAGHGSMGNVYKARDRETGETVALKLLKPEIASDQQMMDRFKNELLFARKITHKNICRVYDFNRLNGIAYTSMEFVEGESLRSVLNRFGGLGLRKGIELTQQLCSGLKEAHAQGIVHRDLKPENVMIDSRGNVKIMDFGIARSMESLTRMTGAMVGTPAYMAPEQVAGKPVDYRTDIYSLGLILYEVFTGTQAFTAENAVAVAMKQLREAPVPPHEIDPQIPVAIERAILKSLEKEPERRFQSIAELEKVFVSPAVAGAQIVAGSTTAGRSTQDAFAMQPTIPVASPAPSLRGSAAGPAPAKSSRGKWVAVLVVLLLFALFAAAAGRWAQNAKLADRLSAPPAPVAPALPDFALVQSNQTPGVEPHAAAPIASKPEVSTAQAEAPSQSAPVASPASIESGEIGTMPPATAANSKPPATAPAAKPAASASNVAAAPADVQQRADAAFKENQSETILKADQAGDTGQQPQPLGSVLRGKGPSYIWVARYDREDRAQDASRKIQGFGLTSVVMPRHSDTGQYYIVLTGPFPPARIPSVIDWLKTQGFPNVREVKGLGGQANGRGGASNPQPSSDGSSE